MNHSQSTSDDHPVWPPKQKKRWRVTYFDFETVAKIFPEDGTKVLCQLSVMPVFSPSKVLDIAPNTMEEQICDFLQVAERPKEKKNKNKAEEK